MPEIVRCENVSLRRGDTTIFQSINWTTSLGQHQVILGSSEAEKTILVGMLTRRIYPSQDSVRILDEAPGRVEATEIHRRMGHSPPALTAQVPGTETVSQVVLSAVWGVTTSRRETYEDIDRIRADSLMELFEVTTPRQCRLDTLSQGEKQRVMVARVLMINPGTLILDGPAVALSLGGRGLLLKGLAELARDPKSPVMVVTTHRLEEIPPRFAHTSALKNGKIFVVGSVDRVSTSAVLIQTCDSQLGITQPRGCHSAKLGSA